MKTRIGRFLTLAAVGITTLTLSPALAQDQLLTEDDIISGSMDIDFGTRTNLDTSGKLKEGSAALGAKDTYKFKLSVAKTTEFDGEITRQPNLYSKLIQKKAQEAELGYSINLAVLNPRDLKQKKVVGKWVGQIPVDPATGAFNLGGGAKNERPLRMDIDAVGKAAAFRDNFGGRLMGKAEKKEGLASSTYKRLVGKREVTVVVKQSDPMRFENVILAKGPAEVYPRTTVSGRLDYDYETSNWITDGIKFRYAVDGKDVEDTLTGTIKWVEDSDYDATGKGYYEFNLRFNEEKNKSATGEGAAFEAMSAEDAFFAVDNSIPCLTGKIEYLDAFGSGGETVISSKVTYHLNANKVTKQQVMNFFKMWMLAVGPTNDD